MRMRIALYGALALLTALSTAAKAQQQPSQQPTDDRLNRLEQRVNQLEQDLKSRDAEIAQLKSQKPAAGAAAATNTSPDAIEQAKQDVLKDIESRNPLVPTLRSPANFNPDLAVIGDFKGGISTDNANPARNRFDQIGRASCRERVWNRALCEALKKSSDIITSK